MNVGVESLVLKALPDVPSSVSPVDRVAYSRDLFPRHHLGVRDGRLPGSEPAIIMWPRDTQEVAQIVAFAAQEGLPVVPFGAGSGVCGGIAPDAKTIVLDLKRMARWRALDRDALTLDVEAGALGFTLEEDLQRQDLTLGHFPSSILCSTVGGWVAARSAGQCSGRYGKIEDMVLDLECVVGNGDVVRFHRRVAGPDATPLIIGSEGVLGVVTSAKLRLCKAPKERAYAGYSFPNIEAGWEAMRAIFQAGLRPAVARLYDPFDTMLARRGKVKTKGAEKHKQGPSTPGASAAVLRSILQQPGALNGLVDALGSKVFGGAMLVLIFEGEPGEAAQDLAKAHGICGLGGAKALGEEPARRWMSHRYGVSYRQAPMIRAGTFTDTMEVASPWSKLRDLYEGVREALGRQVFVMAHLSHAYPDGCSIYFTFAGSAPSPKEAEAHYDETWRLALDAAIAAGGTLSHHHGVGRSKAPKLGKELGAGVDVVRALQGVLDPKGIMNPGNLLPRDKPERVAAPKLAAPVFDLASKLVHARGDATLLDIERAAQQLGLSLGLDASLDKQVTLASWLASGLPGAANPLLDPVDHAVAGFTAKLCSGTEVTVRPAPRRAVGPDLFALFAGTGGQAGTITSAWIRLHDGQAPRPLPLVWKADPVLEGDEKVWIDRMLTAASRVV